MKNHKTFLATLMAAAFFLAHPHRLFGAEWPIPIPVQEQPSASMKDRMLSGMKPITPQDFKVTGAIRNLSLQDIVYSTLKNNHDIRVAAHKPDQARTGIMEAKAAYDPEAFADWQHNRDNNPASRPYSQNYDTIYRRDTERAGVRQHLPTGADVSVYREWTQGSEKYTGSPPNRGSGGAYVVELSQPLLRGFGDKETRTVLQITRLQIEQSEEELRQTIIQSLSDAIEAYWSVAHQKEEIRIQEETLSMAEDLLNRERERQAKGISTPLDVHRAQEAVASRKNMLYQMREQERVAQERLKLLMNSPEAPIGADDTIVVTEGLETPLLQADLNKSIETAIENRPEMRNADLAIRTGEARRSYAKHNLLPKLNVGGSIRRNDRRTSTPVSSSNNDYLGNDWTLGVSLSMPIGNMESRARLRRADSELSQSIDEKRGVKSVIITEVKTAVQNLELLVGEIPVSRQAVEAARKVVAGEWARFEVNQVGNRDLLQAQDLLATAQRSHIQALVRYNVSLARLFATEGTLLDRLGCKIKQ